jgi:hypothetical protein
MSVERFPNASVWYKEIKAQRSENIRQREA